MITKNTLKVRAKLTRLNIHNNEILFERIASKIHIENFEDNH